MCIGKGQCTPNQELFESCYKLFSPDRIMAIRKALGETREQFSDRFFVTVACIKNWESPEGTTKHRELPGPAARLMIAVEAGALQKRAFGIAILKRITKRKESELEKRFSGEINP